MPYRYNGNRQGKRLARTGIDNPELPAEADSSYLTNLLKPAANPKT